MSTGLKNLLDKVLSNEGDELRSIKEGSYQQDTFFHEGLYHLE